MEELSKYNFFAKTDLGNIKVHFLHSDQYKE